MSSKMQSDIDKKRCEWYKKRLPCIDVVKQKDNIPIWHSPNMNIEIQKEKDEKTTAK